MASAVLLLAVVLLACLGYWLGRWRVVGAAGGAAVKPHSQPGFYGAYVALWCAVPALAVWSGWQLLQAPIIESLLIGALPPEVANLAPSRLGLALNDIKNLATGNIAGAAPDPVMARAAATYAALGRASGIAMTVAVLGIGVAGLMLGRRFVTPRLAARNRVERAIELVLGLCSMLAILTTIGIVLSLIFEAIRFFDKVSIFEFLFGLHWSPQTAIRADQVGSTGSFGAVPLFAGTALITLIAMAVAVPVGLMAAIYMSEYAGPRIRASAKPLLEILAGVPTVVYGFFAALTVGPFIREYGEMIGLDVVTESALAAGLVMGFMIIPRVSSLSDDVIAAVPQAMREGSLALGATQSETIRRVVLPAALPGIVSAILLAVSRAIGETMIVVMAAGLAANLTANPLQAVTTVTVQIVTLLIGDQEFDSAKTLAAFALALVLFVVTLVLNVVALRVVERYREAYD